MCRLLLLFLLALSGCTENLDSLTMENRNVVSRETDDDDISTSAAPVICPKDLVSGIPLDEEFGVGTSEITRCLKKHDDIRVVYPLNRVCKNDICDKAYALGNIRNAISDYEITHGLLLHEDYDITGVLYSAGAIFAIDNNAAIPFPDQNPFQAEIEELMAKGVHLYLCQNTARNMGIRLENIIPGIKFVTSGVTAIADLQLMEYALVQP